MVKLDDFGLAFEHFKEDEPAALYRLVLLRSERQRGLRHVVWFAEESDAQAYAERRVLDGATVLSLHKYVVENESEDSDG